MRAADIALALATMLVWGVNVAAVKTGLEELPPFLLMSLRFALVAALTVPFFTAPPAPLRHVVPLSVTLGFLHFGLLFAGLSGTDAAIAVILLQVQVPFAVILARILHGDRPGRRRITGIAVAFAGVALVIGRPESESELPSLLLILAAALAWAVAAFQIKAMGRVDGRALNGWIALLALPQLLAASFLFEHGQAEALLAAGWRGWGAVAYSALLATLVGYGLWYGLVRRYAMSLVMPFTLLVPVFGVASGIVFLGEPLTWALVVGGALTVAGVGIIVFARPQLVEPEAEASAGT